jgi:hypothetical protein
MRNSQFQFCNWHAAQAMKAKWIKRGYTSAELDGIKEQDGNEKPALMDLIWNYLKGKTVEELVRNRQNLLDALKTPEKDS